jgi:hypothetical protein
LVSIGGNNAPDEAIPLAQLDGLTRLEPGFQATCVAELTDIYRGHD